MGCIEHALNDDRRLCSVVLSLIGVANQKLGDCHRRRAADPRELAPLNQPRMTLPLRLALSQPPAPRKRGPASPVGTGNQTRRVS